MSIILDPNQYFYVKNGAVLKDLEDLLNELKTIDEESFLYHVNTEKNDFLSWIMDSIKDEELAEKLIKVKKKDKMIEIIDKRLKKLNKEKYSFNKKNIINQIKGAVSYD